MPYAIKCYFDPQSENHVRSIWADLAKQGIVAHGNYRPHFTFSVGELTDVTQAQTHLEAYAHQSKAFIVDFAYIGVFPTQEGVVYLGLTATTDLIARHQAFHMWFDGTYASQWDYYRVGRWIPHCTIGFHLTAAQIPIVIATCYQHAATLIAQPIQVQEIGLVQVPGASEVCTFRLRE
jgi:hypothetical protein